MKRLIFPLLAVVLSACPYSGSDDYEFEYETIVTETPVNLEGINSPHDDYNSALPFQAARYGIYFSSSKPSGGLDFDIVHRGLDISYHVKDDVLDVHYSHPDDQTLYEETLLRLINNMNDQLGPFSFFGPKDFSYFFYADNLGGDFDIKFTHHLKSDFGTSGGQNVVYGPDTLTMINSEQDDLYPNITPDQSKLFFCSNREGIHFDIYSIALPEADELYTFFEENLPVEPELNTTLSSEFNDKCPYTYNDLMIFTSDREGGHGGFDLYYSRLVNGSWTTPVNFGPEINTEYDEYRPIIFSFNEFQNLVIFSSDRPGGQGGFDLYMVKADAYIH